MFSTGLLSLLSSFIYKAMSSSTQDAIPLFISHEDEIAEKVGSGAKVVWFDGFRDEDCIMPGKTVEEVREEKVQAFLEKYESAHRAGASEEEANSQARAVLKDWTTKGGSVAKSTKRKHKVSYPKNSSMIESDKLAEVQESGEHPASGQCH